MDELLKGNYKIKKQIIDDDKNKKMFVMKKQKRQQVEAWFLQKKNRWSGKVMKMNQS